MALPAARMNDLQACDKHGPAPLPDGALNVKVNSQPTVRAGDSFACGGCPNRVKTGASTVTFGGEFAGRLTDTSDHEGWIVVGSGDVVIGGPTGMGTIGAGKSTCQSMAAGRTSSKTQQSYGNCMVESVRQMLRRAKGQEITEDELMSYVLSDEPPMCKWNPGQGNHGAMTATQAAQVLHDFGVGTDLVPAARGSRPPSVDDLKQAIAARKGVIAMGDASQYWPPGSSNGAANHAIVVTGVELDKDGHVVAVFINDTGLGQCGLKVPADKLTAAMNGLAGAQLVVTKEAIW